MVDPRLKKTNKRPQPPELKTLAKLQKVGLLRGLTMERAVALSAEVEIAAEREREVDPFGRDDPRAMYDRWLDHPFYLYLLEAGLAEGALTSAASLAGLTSMLAGDRSPRVAFAESSDTRSGRMVRVAFPGSSRLPFDVRWRPAELAGVASFALAELRDARRFVRCEIDPRFALAHFESLYLLVSPVQLKVLVKQGIVRDDEQVSDVVAAIARPAALSLRVRGFGAKGKRREYVTVAAMPRGGKWHIQGSLAPAPHGPVATNLTGGDYARLYEIRGWRPLPEPTRATFSEEWEMVPGVLCAIVDGGVEPDRAQDRLRAALESVKQAANGAGTGAPAATLEPTEALVAMAEIGAGQLTARRSGDATAVVVRGGATLEPNEEPMSLEPGDAVVLAANLGPILLGELINLVEQLDPYDDTPAQRLIARAVAGGAVRPAFLLVQVVRKQR